MDRQTCDAPQGAAAGGTSRIWTGRVSHRGDQTSQVYDLKLRKVTVAGIAIDGGHDTAVAFQIRSGSERTRLQNRDGSPVAGQTATFACLTTAVQP